jgi:hypothetical protein
MPVAYLSKLAEDEELRLQLSVRHWFIFFARRHTRFVLLQAGLEDALTLCAIK